MPTNIRDTCQCFEGCSIYAVLLGHGLQKNELPSHLLCKLSSRDACGKRCVWNKHCTSPGTAQYRPPRIFSTQTYLKGQSELRLSALGPWREEIAALQNKTRSATQRPRNLNSNTRGRICPACKQGDLHSSGRRVNFSTFCVISKSIYTKTTDYTRAVEYHCTSLGSKSMQDGECVSILNLWAALGSLFLCKQELD